MGKGGLSPLHEVGHASPPRWAVPHCRDSNFSVGKVVNSRLRPSHTAFSPIWSPWHHLGHSEWGSVQNFDMDLARGYRPLSLVFVGHVFLTLPSKLYDGKLKFTK